MEKDQIILKIKDFNQGDSIQNSLVRAYKTIENYENFFHFKAKIKIKINSKNESKLKKGLSDKKSIFSGFPRNKTIKEKSNKLPKLPVCKSQIVNLYNNNIRTKTIKLFNSTHLFSLNQEALRKSPFDNGKPKIEFNESEIDENKNKNLIRKSNPSVYFKALDYRLITKFNFPTEILNLKFNEIYKKKSKANNQETKLIDSIWTPRSTSSQN